MRAAPLLASIAASLACAGCSGTFLQFARAEEVVVSPSLPHARFDADASEVVLHGAAPPVADGNPRFNEFASRIRREFAQVLSESFRAQASDAGPARFQLTATVEASAWPIAPCLFVLGLFGCPTSVGTANVDLTVEIAGKRYRAIVETEVLAGWYYNRSGTGIGEAALADAAMEAVRQLQPVRTEE